MVGYYTKSRRDVELDGPDTAAAWKLPEPGPLRARGPLLQLEAVTFAYPQQPPARRKIILSNVTLCIEQVTSIADSQLHLENMSGEPTFPLHPSDRKTAVGLTEQCCHPTQNRLPCIACRAQR